MTSVLEVTMATLEQKQTHKGSRHTDELVAAVVPGPVSRTTARRISVRTRLASCAVAMLLADARQQGAVPAVRGGA